jgi:hypothetical protein
LSNPNVAIITPGSPLARAGEIVGTTGRSANLFHQGVLFNQTFNERWSDQFGGDIQLYRNPNQIQLASTADGVVLLVQPGLGLALSGPLTGTGNATTTPGGAIYTAQGFQVARLTYRLNYAGFEKGDHKFPVVFNLQLARNVATGAEGKGCDVSGIASRKNHKERRQFVPVRLFNQRCERIDLSGYRRRPRHGYRREYSN